ncbi:hypothetical protein LZ31DRAFT_560479 [Colletotrichum somersetense]|nr:hypothetical protein LZ31DRAFT_560479 [Colletotrichum somersetense]
MCGKQTLSRAYRPCRIDSSFFDNPPRPPWRLEPDHGRANGPGGGLEAYQPESKPKVIAPDKNSPGTGKKRVGSEENE